MTLLPNVRDELVAAAARRAIPGEAGPTRRRRSRRTTALALAFSLTVAGTAGAALVATGVVGGKPSVSYPRIAGEENVGMMRTHAPVVLGVAQMPTVGTVELVGYRMRGYAGRGSLLCVDMVLPSGSKSGGCDSGLPARAHGVVGTGLTRESNAPKLVTGAANGGISRVTVHYRLGRRDASATAVLIRVPARVAARLDTKPFVYFIAELPKAARSPIAVAQKPTGAVAWTARFPS